MRLTGFGDWTWDDTDWWVGIDPGWIPVVSVEPLVIPRPGTYATFGLSTVGQMLIPCEVGYSGTDLGFEAAIIEFLRRLNPVDTSARELRATQEPDSTNAIALPAVLQIPNTSDDEDLDVVRINFVAVQPFWDAVGFQSVTETL